MKSIALAAAALALALPSVTLFLPKQQAVQCSAAEWIWDTFVGGLGCTINKR